MQFRSKNIGAIIGAICAYFLCVLLLPLNIAYLVKYTVFSTKFLAELMWRIRCIFDKSVRWFNTTRSDSMLLAGLPRKWGISNSVGIDNICLGAFPVPLALLLFGHFILRETDPYQTRIVTFYKSGLHHQKVVLFRTSPFWARLYYVHYGNKLKRWAPAWNSRHTSAALRAYSLGLILFPVNLVLLPVAAARLKNLHNTSFRVEKSLGRMPSAIALLLFGYFIAFRDAAILRIADGPIIYEGVFLEREGRIFPIRLVYKNYQYDYTV